MAKQGMHVVSGLALSLLILGCNQAGTANLLNQEFVRTVGSPVVPTFFLLDHGNSHKGTPEPPDTKSKPAKSSPSPSSASSVASSGDKARSDKGNGGGSPSASPSPWPSTSPSSGSRPDTDDPNCGLSISNVLNSGQVSVMGANAPAEVTASLAGGIVTLTIVGSGFAQEGDSGENNCDNHGNNQGLGSGNGNSAASTSSKIVQRYTVPQIPGYFAATLVSGPRNFVALDDMVPMIPVGGVQQTDSRLTFQVDTRGIVDFQMQGLHRLVVSNGNHWVSVPIKFAKSIESKSHAPTLGAMRLVHRPGEDDSSSGEFLIELTNARDLPLDFRKVWVKLNNDRVFYHASLLSDSADGTEKSTGYIHAPSSALRPAGQNSVTVVTPFGLAIGQF